MTALTKQSAEPTFDIRRAPAPDRLPRDWTWVNWALALSTAPAAVLVMISALGAGCNALGCSGLGSSGLPLFNMLYYGAAVAAGATILLSFFTATRPSGLFVSLCGWGLLVTDVAVLAVTLSG